MEPGKETLGSTASSPRKVRFTPKVPPRRTTKPLETKTEVVEVAEAVQTRELLRRVTEASTRRGPKVEKKSAKQVAFGFGGAATSIRTYGVPKGGSSSRSSSSGFEPQDPISDDVVKASAEKTEKEYIEPWNYYTYYPITLPLRRPYSGNPELLDEEFGEASENYDESTINPAVDLGLMQEESEEPRMLFLQLPASLPFVKRSASVKGKEMAGRLKPFKGVGLSENGCSLEELPPGFMGKMLVYKSGSIKLKLGDILYDVSPGSECVCAQDVVAINSEEKHCCVLGELNKRAVVTPNTDSLLNGVIDLDKCSQIP